jgi:hypothetical protein
MIDAPQTPTWQDIGWNGVSLQLPHSWQPTIIYPSYLFFEDEGQAVFEIKWQQIRGKFSPRKNFVQIRETLKNGTQMDPWHIPPELQPLLAHYTVSGFQLQHENNRSHGLLLYCSKCRRATLVQWYFDPARRKNILQHILASLRDHPEGVEQAWSVFDIKTLLPVEAALQSHEFLPGRYTLCFELGSTTVTLYRFKPAAVLLQNKHIGEFGTPLLNREPVEAGNGWASWRYRAEGLELLLAKARRDPPWQWMRLWHDPEQNVILGVKAEGKPLTETDWLGKICANFTST